MINKHKNGITKEELFRYLQKSGSCGSKETFEKYFPQIEKLLERKQFTPKRSTYFPSETGRKLEEFASKVKIVDKLLTLVEKTPTMGDCFYVGKNHNRFPKSIRPYISEFFSHVLSRSTFAESFEEHQYHKIAESQVIEELDLMPDQKLKNTKIPVQTCSFSLQARYDLLSNLPSFLINFINHPKNNFSEYIKKECMKLISNPILRCHFILQNDYPVSTFYSKQLRNKFLNDNNPTFGPVTIYLCKDEKTPDLEAEFLRILGRYYFIASTNFSIKMKYDSSEKLHVISRFIQEFFPRSGISSNDQNALSLSPSLLKSYNFYDGIISEPISPEQSLLLDIISKSLSGKLWRAIWNDVTNDPLFIVKYYVELFYHLEIFSYLERKVLNILLESKLNFKGYSGSPITTLENVATSRQKF